MNGFVHDPATGCQQEQGLGQGGQVFHFAVAVGVVLIGRPVGDAHGEKGYNRRYEIQHRIGCLGQNTQATSHQADDQL